MYAETKAMGCLCSSAKHPGQQSLQPSYGSSSVLFLFKSITLHYSGYCFRSHYDVCTPTVMCDAAMKEKGAGWILNIASISPQLPTPVRRLTLHPSGASGAGANRASWYVLWYLSVHDTHSDMIADFVCFLDVLESSVFCKYDRTIRCMLHDDSS